VKALIAAAALAALSACTDPLFTAAAPMARVKDNENRDVRRTVTVTPRDFLTGKPLCCSDYVKVCRGTADQSEGC
jgi:hypothetical protein